MLLVRVVFDGGGIEVLRLDSVMRVAGVAVFGLMAGCSEQAPTVAGSEPSVTVTSAVPSTSPPLELKSIGERCGLSSSPVGSTARALKTNGGAQLYTVGAGGGRLGAVLVHGSGSRGICNWAGEVGWLAQAGLNVVAYDQSCVGSSECVDAVRPVDDLLAVVASLRARGASQVVVVGASAGGAIPLVAAARPGSGISAVVSLSSAGLATPIGTADAVDLSAMSVARQVSQPVLFVLAKDDSAATVAELKSIGGATKVSREVLLPIGAGHAQEVLYDESGQGASTFRKEFVTFLRSPSA